MRSFNKIFLFVIALICFKLLGQEHPPIQVYNPNDYGAENQNWSVSQSDSKYIYIANNQGLLEYNGSKWHLYASPNQTIFRSVNVINERIYTGCYREFGYWKSTSKGTLIYTPLSKNLAVNFLEDEEIWKIFQVEDLVLFQSLNRIFIYDSKRENYSIIEVPTDIYKTFKIDNTIYIQDNAGDVYVINNNKAKLFITASDLESKLLVNIFEFEDDFLLLTESSGFYIYDGESLQTWDVTANDQLTNLRIYCAEKLKDHSFLLGTISQGVFIISEFGDIQMELNQDSGLSNNTVLSVFEDVEDNLWLGLENGINCINMNSPFSIYKNIRNNIGVVNTAKVFKDYLYLGTNQGLYFKKWNSNQNFSLISNTEGAVWNLNVLDGELFCGHDSGTFVVYGEEVKKVGNVRGTWAIKPIPNTQNLYLQGNYSGLYVIEKTDGVFTVRNKLAGFDVSSRFFELLDEHTVFVSHEYKGVFKLEIDQAFTKCLKVIKEESLQKGLKTSLVKYNDRILFGHPKGVFAYNSETRTFEKDTLYSKLFTENEYTSGKLINIEESNTLWSASLRHLSYLEPANLTNTANVKEIPLPKYTRNDVSGYENLTYIDDNRYLFGNSYGYIIIDIDKIQQNNFEVIITSVANSNIKDSDSFTYINKAQNITFENSNNNLYFEYTVPEYKKYIVPEYQYKLEGLYDDWSHWSTQSTELFENIPAGNYTFKVRARIGSNVSNDIAAYQFTIKRPWYLSNKMIAVYALLVLLFSMMMHHIYKRYYKIQQRKLLVTKERELHRKELENQQQIMRFRNEQLRQDIDSKNRELGISTMSLIKKNEFLNAIKKELQTADNLRSVKNVVKIIDRNLNDRDDWHVFEEAFNNADKDFLKKIKSNHPELTSNDLRLCAYLRLNLSSKEIAPLLNISTRSVEVKRYRLRKKLNLEHEASLSDYILEV